MNELQCLDIALRGRKQEGEDGQQRSDKHKQGQFD